MFDLNGRVAVVTGGGQGVGAGIAKRLAEHGAKVAVNDLVAERAAGVVDDIARLGGQAMTAVADVTKRSSVDAAISAVAAELGPVDILVNNAGVPPTGFNVGRFTESDPSTWQLWFDINVFGVMHCTQAVLGGMVERRRGRVITISSDAGRYGEAYMSIYAAAKAGAAGFMRSVAREVGSAEVTCNAVSLGSIEPPEPDPLTPRRAALYPTKRLGVPDDVAGAVVWLASDEAGWVTGQTISVNGGFVTA